MASLIGFGPMKKIRGFHTILAVKTRSEEIFGGFDSLILCQLLAPGALPLYDPEKTLLRPEGCGVTAFERAEFADAGPGFLRISPVKYAHSAGGSRATRLRSVMNSAAASAG